MMRPHTVITLISHSLVSRKATPLHHHLFCFPKSISFDSLFKIRVDCPVREYNSTIIRKSIASSKSKRPKITEKVCCSNYSCIGCWLSSNKNKSISIDSTEIVQVHSILLVILFWCIVRKNGRREIQFQWKY